MWITFHQSTEYFFKKSCTQVWIVPTILCSGHFWEIVPTPLSTDNSAGWHQFPWHNWCPARPEWSLSVSDHTDDNLIYQHAWNTFWTMISNYWFFFCSRGSSRQSVGCHRWRLAVQLCLSQHSTYTAHSTLNIYCTLNTEHSTYIVHSTLNTQHILYTVLHRVEYSKGK